MAELAFLHGAGDSAAIWARQAEHFAREHQVLPIDLPGHGTRLGDAPRDSHVDNADEVARLIRQRGFSRPVLVGHSMGGGIALNVALRHPELLGGLVLVASGARLRMHPSFIDAARQKAEAAPDLPQVAGPSIPLEQAVSEQASQEVRAWLRERVGESTARATYADFLANDRFDVIERLGEIALPTLVIAGEDDRLTPPKYQQLLADRLPKARLVLVAGAGHYVQVEQESAFNAELDRFLGELPRA